MKFNAKHKEYLNTSQAIRTNGCQQKKHTKQMTKNGDEYGQ